MTDTDLGRSPDLPRDAEGPVFREPWEAQAFGMTLALDERGHVTWKEWTAQLAALEKLVADKRLVPISEVLARKREWDAAARSTPHGKPIELPGRRTAPARSRGPNR